MKLECALKFKAHNEDTGKKVVTLKNTYIEKTNGDKVKHLFKGPIDI